MINFQVNNLNKELLKLNIFLVNTKSVTNFFITSNCNYPHL